MYELGTGILPNSVCVPLTPSETAVQYYYYPVLCGHYFCDKEYLVNRDRHENPLLMFIRSGAMTMQLQETVYQAQKGDILLIDCERAHCYAADGEVEFLYLHFDGGNAHELVKHLTRETSLIRREENVLIGEVMYQMIQEYQKHSIQNIVSDSLRIYQLLSWIAMPPKQNITQNSPVEHSVQYIRANIGKQMTLDELAEQAHLSVGHYSHEFKRLTGFSPMEYVINSRIEKAKMLLLQTTMTIMDIAYEVGYESGSSLSSLFIKKVGCSPREYRRSQGILRER